MSSPACLHMWKVEAVRDGRLSGTEAAAFARHVASCARCSLEAGRIESLVERLAQLPVPENDPLSARRLRQRLLEDANAAVTGFVPRSKGGRRSMAVVVGLAAAAIVATALAAVTLRHGGVSRAAAPAVAEVTPVPVNHEHTSAPAVHPSAEEEATVDTMPGVSVIAPAHPLSSSAVSPGASSHAHPCAADSAMDSGLALLSSGQYEAAASAFARFVSACGRDRRAEDAAYLRTVALARAGKTELFDEAARDYLVRFPAGFRRTEVQRMLATEKPRTVP